MELRAKITVAVAVCLVAAIGVSTAIALSFQYRWMVASKAEDVKTLSAIILKGIDVSMSQGNTEDVQKSVEDIGENQKILSLRIISPTGLVLKSANQAELGQKLPASDLIGLDPLNASHRIGDGSITYYNPVLNRVQCFGCHNESDRVNGIIEIKYDISQSVTDFASLKRIMIFTGLLTVFGVLLLTRMLFTRFVSMPVAGLMDSMRRVEAGDWDAQAPVGSDDELGAVGAAFNHMVAEVRALHEKGLRKEKEISRARVELDHKGRLEELNLSLEHKIREVETANRAVLSLSKEVKTKNIELEKIVESLKSVNEIGRVLASVIETEDLIKLIIRTAAELMQVERGSIRIMRNGHSSITMQYAHGIGVERAKDIPSDENPYYADLIGEGRTVLCCGDGGQSSAPEGQSPAVGVPIKMKGQVIGGLLLERKLDGSAFSEDDLSLLGTMANQAVVAIENAWLYETVKSNYFGTIQALVNALEASDRYTRGHSERVKFMGLKLGRYIGLDHREIELFEHASILHDIGKIGIDSAVLNKAGRLTNAEFSLIQAHPIIGDEILGPIGTLQGVRTTILQHHERYDGTGYPYGIAGDEISLKARILAVVDTFDAMLSDRPYRKALSLQIVKAEIRRGAGTQFDPFLVNSFLRMIDEDESMLAEAGYNVS